jgi:hypothetical protein
MTGEPNDLSLADIDQSSSNSSIQVTLSYDEADALLWHHPPTERSHLRNVWIRIRQELVSARLADGDEAIWWAVRLILPGATAVAWHEGEPEYACATCGIASWYYDGWHHMGDDGSNFDHEADVVTQ